MPTTARPRVLLRDVAAHAGVSSTTASLVLGGRDIRVTEQTRQRVLRAARELDYRPNLTARSLRTQVSRTSGSWPTPSSPATTAARWSAAA